jgi:hypothetical protein
MATGGRGVGGGGGGGALAPGGGLALGGHCSGGEHKEPAARNVEAGNVLYDLFETRRL